MKPITITTSTRIGTRVRFIGPASIGDDRVYTLIGFTYTEAPDVPKEPMAILGGGMYEQLAHMDILAEVSA